jgi:AcrR family transcriptional regulator
MRAQGAIAAPNKHQQRTEVTRQKLLGAALRVFARDGFEASRIEDIAAEAGHSRGAFYANFNTKEDLFLALLEQQASKRIGELQAAIAGIDNRKQRLIKMRQFYLGSATNRQWAMLTLEFKLYALRHSRKRARLAAAHQRIRESLHLELMSHLNDSYLGRELKENAIKVLLEVLLTGLVLEHSYDPKRVPAEELTNLLGRMFDFLTE